jgi:hypothetical protein
MAQCTRPSNRSNPSAYSTHKLRRDRNGFVGNWEARRTLLRRNGWSTDHLRETIRSRILQKHRPWRPSFRPFRLGRISSMECKACCLSAPLRPGNSGKTACCRPPYFATCSSIRKPESCVSVPNNATAGNASCGAMLCQPRSAFREVLLRRFLAQQVHGRLIQVRAQAEAFVGASDVAHHDFNAADSRF